MKTRIYPRIDQPCSEDWASLSGDERARFCQQCGHHVHNLDELDAGERQRLLSAPGRKCVAYRVTPRTIRISARWWQVFRLPRLAVMAFSILVAMFAGGCATTSRKDSGACPPTLHDKPNTAEEAEDGKSFMTVGIIVDDRPLWKRLLRIE